MRPTLSYHLIVEATDFLESLIHRRVDFRFSGKELKFDLSTALFSSAAVDVGTIALLRSVSQHAPRLRPHTILDVGCGTGPLGIAFAASAGARLTATDRDALAVWFTRRNAALNNLTDFSAKPALVTHSPFEPLPLPAPDLALCNLPAKAGEPVLRHILETLPCLVVPGGAAAVVIVKPLMQLLEDVLDQRLFEITGRHETSGHLAVIYRLRDPGVASLPARPPGETLQDSSSVLPSLYLRGSGAFEGPHGRYRLDVVHNLPEFDSLSHGTELAFRLFHRSTPGGRILVWGAGQGHIPVGGIRSSHSSEIFLADRDLLAVAASTANLTTSHQRASIHPVVAPGLAIACESIGGPVEWMIVQSRPEPGSLWAQEIAHVAEHNLSPGGQLVVVSRSSSLARLSPLLQGAFAQRDSAKHHGYRADLLVRKH